MIGKKQVCCIELGGTTSAVAIANEIGSFIWKKKGLPTAFPIRGEDAVKNICNTIRSSGRDFEAIGIASFGPLNIEKGCIGNSPKPNWKHFPLIEEIRKNLGTKVPIILESDVNAPAYSEYLALHEENPNVKAVAYLTVGTGVGLGVFVDNHPMHGIMHPEFGHIILQAFPGDKFPGICPFHSNCIEGRISANALAQRLKIPIEKLKDVPNEDPIWDMFAYYIAAAATTAAYSYAIDNFVVGGGIMTGDNRSFLYGKANQYCKDMINGYLEVPNIRKPVYNKDAGLVGAAACALHPDIFIK